MLACEQTSKNTLFFIAGKQQNKKLITTKNDVGKLAKRRTFVSKFLEFLEVRESTTK